MTQKPMLRADKPGGNCLIFVDSGNQEMANSDQEFGPAVPRSTIWPESGHSLKDWVYDFGTCSGRKS